MRYDDALARLLTYAPGLTACQVEAEPAWFLDYLERRAFARCAPAHLPDPGAGRLDASARGLVAEALGVVRLELMGASE